MKQKHPQADLTKSLKAELQKTREELKQLENRFALFSLADIHAVFVSVKGVCIDQNDQAERMFGYTSDEAYGRPGTDWIAPEDRNTVMDNMLSGYAKPYRVNGLKKDGTVFPCEIIGRMITYEGKTYRITTVKDISHTDENRPGPDLT